MRMTSTKSRKCQTPFKTQTDKRTNGRRDKWTDARNRIWCILALKCDIWWQYCNDFPDITLTKFRVFIGWSQTFYPPPLNLYKASRFVPLIGRTPLTNTTDKPNKKLACFLCPFVCLYLRMEFNTNATEKKEPSYTHKRSRKTWPRRYMCAKETEKYSKTTYWGVVTTAWVVFRWPRRPRRQRSIRTLFTSKFRRNVRRPRAWHVGLSLSASVTAFFCGILLWSRAKAVAVIAHWATVRPRVKYGFKIKICRNAIYIMTCASIAGVYNAVI